MNSETDQQTLTQLRRQLMLLARSLRHTSPSVPTDLNKPQEVSSDVIFFEGKNQKRKRILLLTKGCSIASCTMCPLPNEALSHSSRITNQNIINQFESAFQNDDSGYDVVTIYNNGNYFSEAEVPSEVRKYIYQRIAEMNVKMLIVESLPQFITQKEILIATKTLEQCRLAVAIGLQSSNDIIREIAINTICTKTDFERAVSILQKSGCKPLVFLMIKPPFVTEKEAIEDTVNSVAYLQTLGIDEAVLCPTKIDSATIVDVLFQKKQYSPPWLWTVVEILKQIYSGNTDHPARIATSLINPDRQIKSRTAGNCSKCNDRVIKAIQSFNDSKNLEILNNLSCSCLEKYESDEHRQELEFSSISITQRVRNFTKSYFSA